MRLVLTTLVALLAAASSAAQSRSLAPFVATPDDVVGRILRLARVGANDVVYDLGSGDGRIVIAAARDFGARAVGIEFDQALVVKARAAATAAGVADRVTFRAEDVMTADLSGATVVTLYLLAASNVALRPVLTRQLRPGTRIVAHDFPIGTWQPDAVETFADAAGRSRTLFLWNFDGVFRP